MSRITNDIENISTTISQTLPSLFSGVLTIVFTIMMMLWFCWQLTLLSCITIILVLIATQFLSKKIRKYSRKRQLLLGQLNGTVEEVISGYRTITAFNRQEKTNEEFYKITDSLTQSSIKTEIFSGVMGPVMNCINNIGFVIIAVFGAYFSLKGYITVGIISAFIVYAKQLSRPINEIAQLFGQIQTAIAGAERAFALLEESNEDQSGEELLLDKSLTITFQNVDFSYVADKKIIQDFTLTIPFGKKIALVGATGSGKTTIVNLLMRFYDINKGNIFINSQNLKDISRNSLRKNIAIVLQDTVLFNGTIEDNLRYGNENATKEQLEKAVKISHCKEMIELMPQGYNSIIKYSGENMSQGQRQLLAIARTFISNPKILILDEATSNVDTRTEKKIQDAMHSVMENRTSIVIAHRLSTIKDSDMIIVMDHGQIVESGNHQSLLKQKGKYYELYMTQYAGFST